jgi:outer membrane immunogenic protein
MTRLAVALLAGVAAIGAVSVAHAADLIVDADPVYVAPAASGNWDGPYIGGFLGYGSGTVTDDSNEILNPDMGIDGWLLGVNVGANFTLTDGVVAGVVGDLAWSNITGEDPWDGYDGTQFSIDWAGSVRGRIGFDGGSFLPYLTAGLAVAGVTESNHGGAGENNNIHTGWTAGAGVEFAVTEDVSVDLLYRYTDYGETDYVTDGHGTLPLSLTTHSVQVGLNWSF